jgi:hypothetical protein
MKATTVLIFLLLPLAVVNCGAPPECKDFLNMPSERQNKEFSNYSIDRQFEIFLCAMNVEPPQTQFASYIADRGESVVKPTVDRLNRSTDQADQTSLIYLLKLLSDRGYLKGRKDVIADISDVIDKMNISTLRESNLEELRRIEINSGVPPFTYIH